MKLTISLLQTGDNKTVETCARMMSNSEPWVTLGRTLQESERILTDVRNETHVIYSGRKVIGFAVLVLHGALVGFIRNIAIAPKWRNRGYGSEAIRLLEERIFRDHPNVFLCVSSNNKDAQRFYRRLGYEKVGEIPDYVMEGLSEWILRKTIGPKTEFYS